MLLSPEQDRFFQIFHPYAYAKQRAIVEKGTRFVHYTTADAAMNILRTKEVWMRKSSCMNDFMEVQQGLNSLYVVFEKSDFRAAIDEIFPNVSSEIAGLFDGWSPHLRSDTYIASVSQHNDNEDTFGRLSMWRAYGEATGIAFVMNPAAFIAPSDALKAYTTPVAYLTDQGVDKELHDIGIQVRANANFIRAAGRETVVGRVFHMLRFAALSIKHPGFIEEQEWRVTYCPKLDRSERLIKDIQLVKGAPQPIYKLPLRDIPEKGLTGIEIPALIDRVIIGPTQFPMALKEAFVDLLSEAGMKDADKKVFMSDIPLRR